MIALPTERSAAARFPPGLAWLNTDHPLTFKEDLRGRVVVLDFWTHCCINCMHVLPNLAQVEQRFANDPVVVIGVHSNKFDSEGSPDSVRQAVLRNQIQNPVVLDEDHRIWRAYGVRAWPTLVFIDTEGQVVGSLAGEVDAETIGEVVQQLLAEAADKNIGAAGALNLRREESVNSSTGLAFPGKVLADAELDRLFIADSSNNRIIEASLEGSVRAIYGSGEAGLRDGTPTEAQFRIPQGMAFDRAGGKLYVADTGNHAVREIFLNTGAVRTISGTGEQSNDREGGGTGIKQGLNSPWDLALECTWLHIAMAGTHQIWRHDLATGISAVWVGSGREDIIDGPPRHAALAQPSGLACHGEHLYFADSEVSAVRRVHLRRGDVETLIGKGLFEFGDEGRPFGRAKLQHPLGVAADDVGLFVADTYNSKIKRMDLQARTVTTLVGGEVSAFGLSEPAGLSVAGSKFYIADTNNHRIVVHDALGTREIKLVFT